MGVWPFLSGLCALAAIAWPHTGRFVAVGLGLFAIGATLATRRPGLPARTRLLRATGVTLGTLALLLGGLKIALTWLAIDKLANLLGP